MNILVAHGDIGGSAIMPHSGVSTWWRTAALVVVLGALASQRNAAGRNVAVAERTPAQGRAPEYMLLLHEDSLYQAPAPAHGAERVREYTRWADSLARAGHLVKAAELEGSGAVTGFFIVTAATEAEARALVATSPHLRYRGTIELRKLIGG